MCLRLPLQKSAQASRAHFVEQSRHRQELAPESKQVEVQVNSILFHLKKMGVGVGGGAAAAAAAAAAGSQKPIYI